MGRALSSLNLQVSALLEFKFADREQPLTAHSKLILELAQIDVPSELRLLLPSDLYSDGHRLLGKFSEVCTDAIRMAQRVQAEHRRMIGLEECGQKLDELQKQIDGLREKLKQAYLATFE